MNRSFIDPITILVPMDSGDFEGGCNHTNQMHHVSCDDADLQHNATRCNATVPSFGNRHCEFQPAHSFGSGHPTHPSRCNWPPEPPDPMFKDLPHVCRGFELRHDSYLNGSVLQRFSGPNASLHCCSACAGWNGTGFDTKRRAQCDGWQIPGGKANMEECFTIKHGTGQELPNPGEAILSGRHSSGGSWHKRKPHNCTPPLGDQPSCADCALLARLLSIE
jgi:hypothetical protein